MNRIYRFRLECGRNGTLEGVFVANENDVAAAMGKRIVFGEVLGKHSDISCVLAPTHLDVLTDDQDFITKAQAYGLTGSGYSPLHYLPEDEETPS